MIDKDNFLHLTWNFSCTQSGQPNYKKGSETSIETGLMCKMFGDCARDHYMFLF